MAAENVVWIEDVRERVETELRAESFPKRVAENILQPVEAGSFDPDERAGDTTTEADDGDVLELGSKLTKEGDFFEVAGLSLTDSLPETTTTQTYQASTLADWATALADVEAVVHVGVAPTRHSDSGETSLALYAQIGDSDVVAFAAPLLPTEDGDESEDEGVDAEEIIQDLQGARTTTEGGECGCGVCRDDGGDA